MLVLALVFIAGGAVLLWKRLHSEDETREAIDIDAVIDGKYPNRAAEAEAAADAAVATDPEPLPEPPPPLVAASRRREVVVDLLNDDGPPPAPAPAFVATGFPPPARDVGPDVPVPGEPIEIEVPRDRPATTLSPALEVGVSGQAGDPFVQLKRRRDRVAAQAAEAFAEVHKLRTQALRRATQAEHNASLAASARNRAGRMVRDTRRVEKQGRQRPSDMPTTDDAFTDVHKFRTEALKRAQQAEHGAQKVSQARERAARLLAEQRELEAEMAKLRRLRTAVEGPQVAHAL